MFSFVENQNIKLCNYIMKKLESNDCTNDYGIQKIRYSIMTFITEMEKIILLVLIFELLGIYDKFLIAFISLTALRIFMGGVHKMTTLGCFLYSGISFLTIIILSDIIIIDGWFNEIIYVGMALTIWRFTPVESEKRVKYNALQREHMKLKAMSVLVIESRFSEHISDCYSNIIHFVMIYIMVENIFICLCKYRKAIW